MHQDNQPLKISKENIAHNDETFAGIMAWLS